MNSRGRARFAASLWKAKRVPSTVWYFILILLCLSLSGAGLTSHLLPVGATAPAQTIPQSTDELWQEITASAEALTQTRELGLDRGRVLRLNRQALAQLLSQAPREFTGAARQTDIVLPLPLPDGTLARFRIEESPAMVPELAAQYPEIKSYRGQGIDDPALTMRCDLTPQGFHALILSGGEAVNIHPVEQGDLTTYFSYSGQDLKNELQQIRCHLDERRTGRPGEPPTAFSPQFQSGATLRTFRLAVATTQEYSNHPQLGGGTVAGAIASLNTWVNNLNVIYETELSVHLNLVTDNRLISTAEPDGFTNGDTQAMINEVPPKLRDVIGPNNYDIGHVLGTDSGGLAGLGVVCDNTGNLGPRKGAGASGMGGPVGNSGSLNLWAHEVGHQFGADHSFNGTQAGCTGNRSTSTSWEPGGGFTTMSYAGNCGNDNTEGRQLRFHAGSLNQMLNYLGGATGASCGVRTNTGNNPPTVSGGPDQTIPRNTPFTLTAVGSDPDLNDLARLTYVWEQIDAGGDNFANDGSEVSYSDANDPPATTRPIFRVFAPTTSPARTFPSLTYILNNANNPPHQVGGRNTAEELPRIGRALNFRVTLRDNRGGGGGVNDDHVTLTVDGNSGPFLVTAPNPTAAWAAGSRQTVTWNVSNTNTAPVNAGSVRILLSTDGGLTFPIVLAAGTPNDGTEDIDVPNGLSTPAARLKVEAIGNIFFDISDANFAISGGAGCPLITSAAPNAGNAGTNITINGIGFTGVTAVRFSGNVAAANVNVVSDTRITATVPAGAVTGPLTLSKANCPDVALAAFSVCANGPETIRVDDDSADGALGGRGYFLNRLTPTNYPATLSRVALRFANFQRVPAGTPITILAGANTDGDANIDNTDFQLTDAQVGALEQFTSYDLARPITISAGDFVVGYRIAPPDGSFPILEDRAVVRNRSYLSGDGVRFEAHATGNFRIRAEFLSGCGGGVTCPAVTGINATNGRPGSTVIITGTNFTDVTAVRFGANAPAVFTINSSTQLTATVPANAATGPITISRAGCPDAQTANFTVAPLACTTVTGINPAKAAPGSAIIITGTGLTGVAVVKFANEVSANFTVNSDTQITATVPPAAAAGPITISRTGCPNVQTAGFLPCGIPLAPLQADDGAPEGAAGSGAATLFLVNRLTPVNYPARLDSVQLRFDEFQAIPTGTNITVLAGANADGDANIDNTAFQTVAARVGALEQFTSYNLTTPLAINSGDFVIGFSITPATNGFPILRDTTAPKGRSYSSTNGAAFNLIDNQANLLIRGQYSLSCATTGNPPPTLASLDPVSVAAGAPGFNLTVNGTNFINGSVVRWNGQDRQTTVVSATQLRIAVAAADIAQAGTASVTVFNPTPGGGVSNALNFSITGATAADTVALTSGTAQTGTIAAPPAGGRLLGATQYTIQAPAGATSLRVLLNGNQDVDLFIRLGQRIVEQNGNFVADFRADSTENNEVIVVTPTSNPTLQAGTYFIAVVNFGPGAANFSVTATVTTEARNNPVPALTSLNPNSATAGGAAFTLTVTGTNFINGSVVRWNGQGRTTNFVSATQLTAAIPATDIAQAAGTASVTVFTPTPGGGVSNAVNFTITGAVPADTVALTSGAAQTGAIAAPAAGGNLLGAVQYTIQAPAGATSLRVLLNGNQDVDLFVRFGQRIVVQNGNFVADFRADSTENNEAIVIEPTSNPALRVGTYFIAVANYGPGAANFSVNATATTGTRSNPVPALTSLNPNSAIAGGAAFTLTATGTNFINGSVVRWNGQDRTTTFASATQMTAAIPASDIAQAGTASVTVFNPTPGGGVSNAVNFAVTGAIVDTVALTSGAAQTGAIAAPAAGGGVLGAVQYTIQVPAGATSLRVSLNGNQDVDLFIRFGQRIVVQNGNFVADFRADSTENNEEIVVTPTSNPALRAGTYFIAVANFGPGAANFSVTATVTTGTQNNPAPALISLNPNSATAGGAAFTLTATGTNFINGSVVRWNGQGRTTNFVNATQLTAAIPATDIAQSGTASVTVFTPAPGGGASNALNFTITGATTADTVALTSGTAQTGAIAAPTGGGVLGAVQYTIQVPAGATALRVLLNGNQGVDVDLFVRFGQRIVVQDGNFVADFRSESAGNNEEIVVTPASNPALRAGTYFIAVANFGPGAANFSVTATVTTDPNAIALTSGVTQTGSIPAPDPGFSRLGMVQYTIQVPAGATALRVLLNGNQGVDVDLFVRFGQRIVVQDGGLVADFRSDSAGNNEEIVVTPASNPALRAGTYYIAVVNYGPGAANLSVAATVTNSALDEAKTREMKPRISAAIHEQMAAWLFTAFGFWSVCDKPGYRLG